MSRGSGLTRDDFKQGDRVILMYPNQSFSPELTGAHGEVTSTAPSEHHDGYVRLRVDKEYAVNGRRMFSWYAWRLIYEDNNLFKEAT